MYRTERTRGTGKQTVAVVAAFAVVAACAVVAAGGAAIAPSAQAAPSEANTLVVHADEPFRPVTHVATGSLYGLATATVPSDALVKALKPNTFVQMAPGGSQLPNGEPKPAGDALVVAPEAAKAGAKVVVRMPDWYPNFPYGWTSWPDWLKAVDTQIASVQASHATNIAAYEIWNEPDWTWVASKAGSFNDGWARTYKEIRSKDATTPIQGPSYSIFNLDEMKAFLQNAIATNTVPNIISWHELSGQARIADDVAAYRNLESSLGISPLPIAIGEYATPTEVGVPGSMVGYIAKFERAGVHDAEMAFWNHYGTLGDTLTDTGGSPNGSYWLYKWYGDMSGNMVATTPPAQTGIDGAASVSADRKQLDAIFGGGSGASAVTIDGLDSVKTGAAVDVKLEYTPSRGRTNAVDGPITISDTMYVAKKGSITVPVAMNPANGYHLVITPHRGSLTSLAGTYRITNVNSGLAMDTTGGATSQGALVDQSTTAGGKTQLWSIRDAGSGLYKIVNQVSGLLLGVSDSSTQNGANALIWGNTGATNELWELIPDGAGHYLIANDNSGLVLGVADRSTSSGANVVQWTDGAVTSTCTATGARVTGKLGNAVALCGNNEYVSLPTGIVSGVKGDFTVSAWVNPSQNTTWTRLFDFGTGTKDYMFLTANDGTGVRFAITTNSAGGEQQIKSSSTLPLNTWSLVTVTVSGTTGTLYVNGQPVGTNSNITLHPSDLGSTTQNWIGRSEYGGDPYLNAKVDDFNVYSRALSASEVAALASGHAGTGDVAHYAFDETGGATATDSSGNGRDATIVSNPTAVSVSESATADHLWTLTPVKRSAG